MKLSVPVIGRLAFAFILSLAFTSPNMATAGEQALPPATWISLEPRATDQQDLQTEAKHTPFSLEEKEYIPKDMALLQSPRLDGLLAPSMAPVHIDPTTTSSKYHFSAVVSYNYGLSWYNQGRLIQARDEWQAALRLQPTFSEAHYALSLLSHLQGNMDNAFFHAIKARLHKSDWAAAHYHAGLLHYKAGQFALASQNFLKALQLEPNQPMAMNGLGLSILQQGHLPDAANTLTTAAVRNPDKPHIHHNLGLAFYAQHQWEQAGRQLKKALRLDPTLGKSHFWLGMTYAAMSQWTQAISSWQQALALHPFHSHLHLVYFNLGTAFWMTGNPLEAQQAYHLAARTYPAWPQAHYQLGVIDMALSRWNQASQHFLTASQLAPDWEQPYFNLGLVRYYQGLLDEALEAFQQTVTLQPDSSEAQYYLGLTLRVMRQDDRALIALEHAAQAGHTHAQEMLAGMYANGRGTPRNLTLAMRWWHRASRGPRWNQAAEDARAKLSRLRQLYFLHREKPGYSQELRQGFHAIQHDLWQENRERSPFNIESLHDGSMGTVLATAGRYIDAVPLLVREAYALNQDSHRHLELLIQQGVLTSAPIQLAQVIQYFTETASEGSVESCRFLSSLKSQENRTNLHLQIAHIGPLPCKSPHP